MGKGHTLLESVPTHLISLKLALPQQILFCIRRDYNKYGQAQDSTVVRQAEGEPATIPVSTRIYK